MNVASFIVASFLRAAGWPQQRGLLRKRLVVSAMAADMAVRTLTEMGAGIGATSNALAAAALANVFVRIDWHTQTSRVVNSLVVAADAPPDSARPYEVVLGSEFPVFARTPLAVGDEQEITWEAVGRHEQAFGLFFARAVVWGNRNHESLNRAIDLQRANWQPSAREMRSFGLDVSQLFPMKRTKPFLTPVPRCCKTTMPRLAP